MKEIYKLTLILLLVIGVTMCSDYLNPSTPGNKPIESINGVKDLKGLLIGAYNSLAGQGLYGRAYLLYGDIRTANAFASGSNNNFVNVTEFTYLPSGHTGDTENHVRSTWDNAYEVIAHCNLIINSEVERTTEVKHVVGKAYAIRALAHMILLELYGQQNVEGSNLGIPYVTTFGDRENFFPSRLTVEATNNKITADFKKAIQLMDPANLGPSTTMTYYAAVALLARHYMKTEEYAKASATAKKVIESGIYSLLSGNKYVDAWGTDGEPSFIFGMAYTPDDNYHHNGFADLLTQDQPYRDIEVTKELYNLFEDGDIRNKLYKTYGPDFLPKGRVKYRTLKFPASTTNIPVIRYAEVILIYAEAQLRQGNEAVALTYLNKIPAHRNASLYGEATLENILLERRKEFAMEGRYFWTLMRMEQDITRESMRSVVSFREITVPYGDHRLALPIPAYELTANPNIQQM